MWDELSRILPDHTFLTETRIADGTVTLSGFSADAARLVRIIDQSPLFSGATLTSAITPDANERKDRFSIVFKLRGARAASQDPGPRHDAEFEIGARDAVPGLQRCRHTLCRHLLPCTDPVALCRAGAKTFRRMRRSLRISRT